MKLFQVILGFSVALLLCLGMNVHADDQEHEFVHLIKNLLQGDELKTFQSKIYTKIHMHIVQNCRMNFLFKKNLFYFSDAYSALPVEIRDKLTKDLLQNPGQIGQNLMSMFGPQVQNIMQNLGNFNLGNLASIAKSFQPPMKQQQRGQRQREEDNEINVEVEDMNMNYNKNDLKTRRVTKESSPLGFDFSHLGSMLGNLVSSNPEMLVNLIQGFTQGTNGKQGFSFDSIFSMLSQQVDFDTLINMASAFGGGSKNGKTGGFADMLQIQEMMKWWGDFIKSPTGQKVNRVLPRLLKAQTLPDALRIIEKEMAFRFDMILRQIQDPNIRQLMVAQAVKPVGEFFRGIKVPSDLKEVINKADDVLNNKMGLGDKTKAYIEPITQYIRETFKISKESLLDLSPTDIEKIASDILNKEVLEPMTSVWDAHQKSIDHSTCASFIFCQLNNNFYSANFIRRYVIKTSR